MKRDVVTVTFKRDSDGNTWKGMERGRPSEKMWVAP